MTCAQDDDDDDDDDNDDDDHDDDDDDDDDNEERGGSVLCLPSLFCMLKGSTCLHFCVLGHVLHAEVLKGTSKCNSIATMYFRSGHEAPV